MCYGYKYRKDKAMAQAMIEELQGLSREELIKRWKEIFKTNSPQYATKDFLLKHLAWELQAKEQGGLSATTKKKLDNIVNSMIKNGELKEISIGSLKEKQTLEIKAGTKLIRKYNGKVHEVIVFDKGFKYNDKIYKSLSSIANEITGTRWNGKVFFGAKKA